MTPGGATARRSPRSRTAAPATSVASEPTARTAPGARASTYDWVNRRLVTGRTMRPSSTSHTPLRVSPVTTIVRGSRTRVYHRSVTSRPRSTSAMRSSDATDPASSTRFAGQRPKGTRAGHRVPRGSGAGGLRRAAVLDEAGRDALANELVATLRGPLGIEADADRHRVRDVVGDRDGGVELRRPRCA